MLTNISKKEWIWVTTWGVALMLLTSLPYLYGWWLSTSHMQFSGHILGVEDGNSYLAKMRLGATGGWLFYLIYTPEPHAGAVLFTFHLILGKLAKISHLPPILVYHLARFFFGLGLLLTLYSFISYFIQDVRQRRWAFLLAATGGGLGWLLIALQLTPVLGLPLDWYVPEAFIFLVLFHLPHLALAEIFFFWSLIFTLQSWQTQTWRPVMWAGLMLVGMALITAFYIGVYLAVLGLTWLTMAIITKAWMPVRLAKMIVPTVMALPILLYDAYVFTSNPVFKVWSQQNIILSPELWHYGLAYGLLILLALYGGWLFWRNFSTETPPYRSLFLIIWCVIFPILVYLPFNLQRRLVVGAQIPLVILATYGLRKLSQSLRPTQGRLLASVVIFLFSLTNLLILIGSLASISGRQPPIFIPGTQVEAMAWLSRHTQPGEVVLGTYASGNVLPAYADVRVLVGHGPETVNSDEKRALAQKFFNSATSDAWRRELLTKYNIRYVYYGPAERRAGDFRPENASYLSELYQNSEAQIFGVDVSH
ncbi:MAG: hypothetical protein U0401_35300 [Anaerolineae bacterium]